ncbi:MAG: Lrp/AsnC ligand binding domain-containing protein [Candidatus Thermoplasmatota archaeon]
MAELSEESVFFLRVTPGRVEHALEELRRHPHVKEAEAVMGTYDVAVTGAFRSSEELRKFQAELEAKDFCEGCAAHPGFENWRREEAEEEPVNGWTLIRAVDVDRAMKDLQRVPSVQRIIGTTGEYNLIARIGAKDPNALQETVIRDIQKIHGIRRTETRPSLTRPSLKTT